MTPALALPLVPRPVARPWGGRRVAPRFGWTLPDGQPIGEWWLASCYPGATTVLQPTGQPLPDWLDGAGRARGLPGGADFPLLLKFLDCEERLSLQVHPDDATAAAQGLPCGKTEAWHILQADPGAAVWLGTAPGVRCGELLDAVAAGADEAEVLALLRRVEVAAGDTLLVPAGSLHAVGPGLLLFEVQQSSDTTWRVHDWGRGRAVHLAQARQACRDLPPEAPRRTALARGRWTELVRARAFALHRAGIEGTLAWTPAGAFGLLTVLAGSGEAVADRTVQSLSPGDTLLICGAVELRGSALDVLAVDGPA